jgi:hypothetical protein
MISWIDDNMIVGPTELVLKLKSEIIMQFECEGCGALTEYIWNEIKYGDELAIRMVQAVLTQSYEDEFELKKRCYNMPATPGTVLIHPAEGDDVLSHKDQRTLRSGMGKLMYQMQYSRPNIAQSVQDLVGYMIHGDSKILKAMRRCMRYKTVQVKIHHMGFWQDQKRTKNEWSFFFTPFL